MDSVSCRRPCGCQYVDLEDRNLTDDVNSLYITWRDYYGNAKSSKPKGTLDKSQLGPQVIHVDMWRAQGWDVATHGGALTFPHHDVSGFATFLYPRSGTKMWGLVRVHPDHIPDTREKLFNEYDKIVDEDWESIESTLVMKTIPIEEGDIL